MELFQYITYFISGLAIFFFGQRSLSQGLQAIGGKNVKHIVHDSEQSNSLKNFFDGARLTLFGFSPTMSSMVITGLANANLLKDYRIIPMMMGTTLGAGIIMTVLSLETHQRGLNLIAIGLILSIILQKFKLRTFGKFIIGLGLSFLGIAFMEEAINMLGRWSEVKAFFLYFNNLNEIVSMLMLILIGLSLSITLMSSSMVLAMIVVFARLNVMTFSSNFALTLGAFLASYLMTYFASRDGSRAYSKRKVFIATNSFIATMCVSSVLVISINDSVIVMYPQINTLVFSVVALSLLSFIISLLLDKFLKAFALQLYPDGELKEQSKLKFLGEGRFLSPTMAYVLVEMEVSKLMDVSNRMFLKCEDYLDSSKKGARALAKIKEYERIIDNIQFEIDIFIEKVISSGAGEDDSKMSIKYLKLASSLEQVADSLDKLATMLTKFYEQWTLTHDEKEKLLEYYGQIYSLFKLSYAIFTDQQEPESNPDHYLEHALELKKKIMEEREFYCIEYKDQDPLRYLFYSDVIVALAKLRGRVRDIFSTIHS